MIDLVPAQLALFADDADAPAMPLGTPLANPIGTPIPPEETKKMELEAAWQALGPCYVATKYDGYRLQVHRDGEHTWLYTRNLHDWTSRFPTLVDAAVRQIASEQAILDAELLAFDPHTRAVLPRAAIGAGTKQAYKLIVFDVLAANGRSMLELPLQQRLLLLRSLVRTLSPALLEVAHEEYVDSFDVLQRLYRECVAASHEGLILKSPFAHYKVGERNPQRVKVKVTDTVDAAILGFNLRPGKDGADAISTLLVGVYDPDVAIYIAIATVPKGGCDRKEWSALCRDLFPVRRQPKPSNVVSGEEPAWWVMPDKIVELDAYGREPSRFYTAGRTQTGTGYQLAAARISARGLRIDKRPQDATTLAQFLELRLVPGYSSMHNNRGEQPRLF